MKVSRSPHPRQHLVLSVFFFLSHSDRCVVVSHLALICVYLMSVEVEHHLTLFAIWGSSFFLSACSSHLSIFLLGCHSFPY